MRPEDGGPISRFGSPRQPPEPEDAPTEVYSVHAVGQSEPVHQYTEYSTATADGRFGPRTIATAQVGMLEATVARRRAIAIASAFSVLDQPARDQLHENSTELYSALVALTAPSQPTVSASDVTTEYTLATKRRPAYAPPGTLPHHLAPRPFQTPSALAWENVKFGAAIIGLLTTAGLAVVGLFTILSQLG